MPAVCQSAIKSVNKVSGTGGGSSSGTETVSDSCFLLAEIEIFGITTNSVSGEGSQYAYYKAGNSKVKKKGTRAEGWFDRSPSTLGTAVFCYVENGGRSSYANATTNYGVAFGFCV